MTVADAALGLVRRSTEAQGLPETVTDRAVLTTVAAILSASSDEERKAS